MPDLFLTLSWEVRDSSYFILSKKEDALMIILITTCGFPGVSVGKESSCNSGDLDSILGLERCPEGEHNNPFQYSCLENPMDRGAWRAAVHGVGESDKTE